MNHDGNIYRAAELLRVPERRFMDFSSPVNPLGVSKKIKAELRRHLKYLVNYPDPHCVRMRRHIAKHINVNMDQILCGNGSTELIHLIVRALKPGKVLIPSPTSPEYERAVIVTNQLVDNKRRSESSIQYLDLQRENGFRINPESFSKEMDGCTMAFLSNPNNPTGTVLKKDDVMRIAEEAERVKCYLLVDEAFIDFVPGETVVEEVAGNPYLMVVRSMTSYYALSGLRVGYGVFHEAVVSSIREIFEPWIVNSLAQRAAVIALKDKMYRKETVAFMKKEKSFLEEQFRKLDREYLPSDANFYLMPIPMAESLYEYLLKRYILVGKCDAFRGLKGKFLRIAVKNHRENTLLIKALREFITTQVK